MTGLFFLALGSAAWRWRAPGNPRLGVLITWAAAVPMTLALLAAVAVAQRYTGDFCPFLIVAAAFGSAALAEVRRLLRAVLGGFLGCATLWSVIFTVAVSLHYQGATVWGVPDDARARYKRLQQRIDSVLATRGSPAAEKQ
jgi:hypothetical protein